MSNQDQIEFVDGDFDDDDFASNESGNTPFSEVSEMSRRSFLGSTTALTAAAALTGTVGNAVLSGDALAANSGTSLTFKSLPHGYDENHHVAEGYDADILIRWGDPVENDAPAFDPMNQSAVAQARQFGYNNDFIGFTSLPVGSDNPDHGLLCVNHEYTNAYLMFPGAEGQDRKTQRKEHADIEMAAHGHSIVEIKRASNGKWSVVKGSRYNRRIHVDTKMMLSGPAAGHDMLKTSYDSTGKMVYGTLNNCAGSMTPWGTVLMAEENFHGYFMGDSSTLPADLQRNYDRYGLKGKSRYSWGRFHDRFNINKEPNEPNRFGWMVEFDPYDPDFTPIKRTALGRFKHEGAHAIINKDGHVVVYSGDDQRFDYVYKFVSANKYNPNDRMANFDLLDDGTLYVGKFNADKTLEWLPLEYGKGPLTSANAFTNQAEVLIETRRAADLMGATPMDRPEDVQPNEVNGKVYMMLTNNTKRKAGDENSANPRAENAHGHIIEMIPPGGMGKDADHAATSFTWEFFLMAGDPKGDVGAKYNAGVEDSGWFSAPDNVEIDTKGRVWISTDGSPKFGFADGIWATDAEGDGRALTKLFFACPRGAELCGPEFNNDDTALFAAVQHPGDEKKAGSVFENPTTRWPDFDDNQPVKPSVVVISKKGGGQIG